MGGSLGGDGRRTKETAMGSWNGRTVTSMKGDGREEIDMEMASIPRVMGHVCTMEGLKTISLMVTEYRNTKMGCVIKAGGSLVYVKGTASKLGQMVVGIKADFRVMT